MSLLTRPKFQSSLFIFVTTAKVWGYDAPIASVDLNAFKNDEAIKGVFTILNKLFSDKTSAVSFFIHHFLLNKVNLAKPEFKKTFIFADRTGSKINYDFPISNNARVLGLWTTEGERALMNPNFQLSSLEEGQKGEDWLLWLTFLVWTTAVFDSDYAKKIQGAFNLQKTRKNIRNLFVGWAIEEMKVQLKDDQGLFVGRLNVLWEEMKVQLKGEQGNKGVQGLGTPGDQGLRGPAGQNGQIKKEVVIGLSIGLGVVFCLFLACVMVIYQRRVFYF